MNFLRKQRNIGLCKFRRSGKGFFHKLFRKNCQAAGFFGNNFRRKILFKKKRCHSENIAAAKNIYYRAAAVRADF